MIINTHEKFLKQHGCNLYEKLNKEGYIGNKEVVYAHFLEAVIELDSLIRSGQSAKNPVEQLTEKEYFELLTNNMNALLLSEHNYPHIMDPNLSWEEKEQKIKRAYKSILGVEKEEFEKAFN